MLLFYIRHGQSVNNALYETTGDYSKVRNEDPELTEMGKVQASMLGEFITQIDKKAGSAGKVRPWRRDYFGFTHVYCSLMVRAIETAIPVARAVNKPLTAWPDIHETGGIFLDDLITGQPQGLPGKTRAYFQDTYRDLILTDDITEDGWWNRPFEPDEDRPLRARRVLNTLLERHGGTDDRVAIVSHGGFYNHLMREIIKLQVSTAWLTMWNTGISCVEFTKDGYINLLYHNRTDHLPENLIT